VITITGISDHLRPESLITITGMRMEMLWRHRNSAEGRGLRLVLALRKAHGSPDITSFSGVLVTGEALVTNISASVSLNKRKLALDIRHYLSTFIAAGRIIEPLL
jgi:hypothetical protein